jgi:hypothetical protein
MYNPTAGATSTRRPSQLSLLFHIRKTFSLVGAVLQDERVHWLPKIVFLSCIGALLLAVVAPEAMADLVAALGLPGLGLGLDALGLPVDATIDWAAFAVAAFNLLRLFPAQIVGEHYDRLFRSRRGAA